MSPLLYPCGAGTNAGEEVAGCGLELQLRPLGRFSYADLVVCEKFVLSPSWLREYGANDPTSLPPRAKIAASIAEEMETELARFRTVAARLE